MEICEERDAFAEEGEELVFSHTKFILKEGEQYYYATSKDRIRHNNQVDVASLDLVPIPTSQISPSFPAHLTRAPEPLPENCYVKRPSLIECGDGPEEIHIAGLVLQEAEICEILRQHPHPNIAKYLGCLVSGGKITGLCFIKYQTTLPERLEDPRPFERELCMKGIKDGVGHLHGLGLIHCDLNPYNIMLDGENPVIIDFDSCKRNGEELGIKAGTFEWTKSEFTIAAPENDHYGLEKIRQFISSDASERELR